MSENVVFKGSVPVSELMRLSKEREEKDAGAREALEIAIHELREKGEWRPWPEALDSAIERLEYALSRVSQ